MAASVSRDKESRQSAQPQWSPVQRGLLPIERLSIQMQAILGKGAMQLLRDIQLLVMWPGIHVRHLTLAVQEPRHKM